MFNKNQGQDQAIHIILIKNGGIKISISSVSIET